MADSRRFATPRSKEWGRKPRKEEAKHLRSGARFDAIAAEEAAVRSDGLALAAWLEHEALEDQRLDREAI